MADNEDNGEEQGEKMPEVVGSLIPNAKGQKHPNSLANLRPPFPIGNAGGPGNPNLGKIEQIRATLLQMLLTPPEKLPDDAPWLQRIVFRMLTKAEAGDNQTAKELFDRAVGKPAYELPKPEQGLTIINNVNTEEAKEKPISEVESLRSRFAARRSSQGNGEAK